MPRNRSAPTIGAQKWAIVSPNYDVLDVVPDLDTALSASKTNHRAAIVDRELDLGPTIEQNPLGARGPSVAHRALHNLRIDPYAVQQMSLDEAFERLAPIFPAAKRGTPVKAWSSARLMSDNLLGVNYKTSKTTITRAQKKLLKDRYGKSGIDVQGLTLLPNVVWNLATYGDDWKSRPASMRVDTCVGASRECAESCLVYSGQNEADPYNAVIKTAKMTALLKQPNAF